MGIDHGSEILPYQSSLPQKIFSGGISHPCSLPFPPMLLGALFGHGAPNAPPRSAVRRGLTTDPGSCRTKVPFRKRSSAVGFRTRVHFPSLPCCWGHCSDVMPPTCFSALPFDGDWPQVRNPAVSKSLPQKIFSGGISSLRPIGLIRTSNPW